jgi:hypothetical protein
MSRSTRLTAAAVVALSAFALAPSAQAYERLICRGPDNVIHTTDMDIYYPNIHRC